MSNVIEIKNSTIVTGATASNKYLVCKTKYKQIGIPVYEFQYSTPPIDFVNPDTELVIEDTTLYDYNSATIQPYNAAIAVEINGENYGIPIYTIEQSQNVAEAITFHNTTTVSDLTARGEYLVAILDNTPYGIPLVDYSSRYPFTSSMPMSAIGVDTVINLGPPTNALFTNYGSTNLNSRITTFSALIERIKMRLGWPVTNIEMCDDQIADFIDEAMEWYSKYAGITEEYLAFNSNRYVCGVGLKLDDILMQVSYYQCNPCTSTMNSLLASAQFIDWDIGKYRKVAGVFSVDRGVNSGSGTDVLFNIDYMFAQQAYFGQLMGGLGYDLITWHNLKEWLDLRKKMFATEPYYTFDPRSQILKLTPEPNARVGGAGDGHYIGVIGCRVERSIDDMVQERWVQRYAQALTMISLGHIRGKFGGVTLFGGGQVNATDIMTQGLEMRQKLEDEILNGHGEVEPGIFLVG